jgi:hypothetical protein
MKTKSSFYGSKGEDKENVENNDAEITISSFFFITTAIF